MSVSTPSTAFERIFPKLSPRAQRQAQLSRLKARAQNRPKVVQKPLSDFPDIVEWIQSEFYIPETGQPMELYPAQIVPLREALSLEGGLFKYSLVLWSAIKKSAKSSIAAAVGLWMAFNRPYASVRVIGNDLKQSQSRVYAYMTRAIDLHPEWKKTCKVNRSEIYLPNKSKIEAVACDPSGEAGGGDDIVIYTELWAWKNEAAKKLWTETTLSPLLYGKSLRWADTYAGFSGGSPVLEPLHQSIIKGGQCLNEEYEMYANYAARAFGTWVTKPSLPWQTQGYYQSEAATLTEEGFLRVHKNQFVSDTGKFVPDEWWKACDDPALPALPKDDPCVLALDAAISNDCFGVLMLSGRGDGENYDVRYAQAWYPPKGGEIDYKEVEAEVRRLIEAYNIAELAYDKYQLHDMMNRFRNEMIVHTYDFSQQTARAVADKDLQDKIKARRIHHQGEPDLKDHIQNANAKTEGERMLRLVKRADHLKIDLAVALSMALARAQYWQL